jgi:hypothetical protein
MQDTSTANKWFPVDKKSKVSYPSPQSILREAVGVSEYSFICKTTNTIHIRAAVIMPARVSYAHLLTAPWAMIYKTKLWVMIIVSISEPTKWLDIAKSSGALAWQKGPTKSLLYQFELPDMDLHGLEVRPNNTGLVTDELAKAFQLKHPGKPRRQTKDYDYEEMMKDIIANKLTYVAMAEKYNISRITVMTNAHRAGYKSLRAGKPHVKA